MQHDDLTPVNLWLAGRSYRILVKKNEADPIRRAVKVADEKITELKQAYSGKDDQDFLAMCLLMYATDNIGTNSMNIADELNKLNEDIDKVLG